MNYKTASQNMGSSETFILKGIHHVEWGICSNRKFSDDFPSDFLFCTMDLNTMNALLPH